MSPRKTEWAADDMGYWWRFVKWGEYHNTIEDVEPFILQLSQAKGISWLTTENVQLLLKAKDPSSVEFKSPHAGNSLLKLRGPRKKRVDSPQEEVIES